MTPEIDALDEAGYKGLVVALVSVLGYAPKRGAYDWGALMAAVTRLEDELDVRFYRTPVSWYVCEGAAPMQHQADHMFERGSTDSSALALAKCIKAVVDREK